jgi:hypothetical protein
MIELAGEWGAVEGRKEPMGNFTGMAMLALLDLQIQADSFRAAAVLFSMIDADQQEAPC